MAREGYLLHAGEESIHDPSAEQKADTPHKKWDNFWYYHKVHVIIAILILAVVIFSVWSTLKTVHPDYTVGMITQQYYPEEAINTLQDQMQKYGSDLNGDGRTVVQIVQYYLAPVSSSNSSGSAMADPQVRVANQVKLEADISAGTSIIFITDDASFRSQEKQGRFFAYLDGSTPPDGATDYDKMRIPLQKCPEFAGLKVKIPTSSGSVSTNLFKNLDMSLRIYKGSGIEGKEKDYYQASKQLFQKLTHSS